MVMQLGAFTSTDKGETGIDATKRYESLVGKPSAYTRHYVGIDQPLDGSFMVWSASQGKTQVIAIHARTNSYNAVRWTDIANGDYDDVLKARAAELLGYDGLAYLMWHHEPENDTDALWTSGGPDQDGPSGTAADYQAAGLHVRTVIRQAGVASSRALFGQCLMAGTYGKGHGGYDAWKLPFAILAVDGYDRYASHSFSELFMPAHNVAQTEHKQLFVEECGTVEDPQDPKAKAGWFEEAAAIAWPELVGVEYSNVTAKADYRIDTSADSLAAYKAWAQKAG